MDDISFFHYRPQRSCDQGNVFTGVCLSTGGGVCLSACWDARPHPPDQTPSWTRQTPPWTRQTPPDQADPSRTRQTPPPGKQTPAYILRAAGTHPTRMYSCFQCLLAMRSGVVSQSLKPHPLKRLIKLLDHTSCPQGPTVFMSRKPEGSTWFSVLFSLIYVLSPLRGCPGVKQ